MSRVSRMSREEFERQAVLYAMGALSPEEARRFEMERARRGAEGESLDQGLRQAFGPRSVTPVERMALAAVTSEHKRRPPWPWIIVATLFIAAGAGAIVWGLGERRRAETASARVGTLDRTVDSLEIDLARMNLELRGRPRAEELAPLLASGDMVVIPLEGPVGNTGRIVMVPGGGAVLVASNITALAEGSTYQLWRTAAGVTQPVAPLGDARRGFLFSVLSDDDFLQGAEAVFVTAEDAPGAVLPSDTTILQGRL